MKVIKFAVLFGVAIVMASSAMAQVIHDVDCSGAGGLNTVAAALDMASPGDTISITGPCSDTRAVVSKDDLTIVGAGGVSAVLDGGDLSEPVLLVDGARRVSIADVTVMNGQHGIRAIEGAALSLSNVVAQANANDGVSIDIGATARIQDCTAQDNGDDGFAVLRGSSAIFSGAITSMGNADDGIAVVLSASATLSGATVAANNNGQSGTFPVQLFEGNPIGDGIRATDASSLFISNSNVEVMGNGDDGIGVSRTASFLASAPAEDNPVTITVMNNVEDGIEVTSLASFSAFGSQLTLTVSGNGRRAFNIINSNVNLFAAIVTCSEIPTEATCP